MKTRRGNEESGTKVKNWRRKTKRVIMKRDQVQAQVQDELPDKYKKTESSWTRK